MTSRSSAVAFLTAFLLFSEPIDAANCTKDFEEIRAIEATINDTSVLRDYILCPYQVISIGQLDFSNEIIDHDRKLAGSTNSPLPLRPNMHIKCGESGSKANLCYVSDGTLQLDGTSMRGIADTTVDNVVIEGFVFTGAIGHSLLVNKPGSITFRDCEWRDFKRSKVPIMMDYFDSLGDSELVITIQDSIFRRNRYFGDQSYSALIYGNSNQNRLILERTVFSDNDMIWNNTRSETHSYLIETLGPVCMDLCCFTDNMVGAADVAVFGSELTSFLVHDSNSTGALCSFAASFETIQQYEQYTPVCIDATAPACNFAVNGTDSVCSN